MAKDIVIEFKRPPREPDFIAEIYAIKTKDGGRLSPLFSGYRPDHDFGIEGMLNGGMHEYPETGTIEIGETGKVNIWLLAPEYQENRLFSGMEFTAQEGARIVCKGKIISVINKKLQQSI